MLNYIFNNEQLKLELTYCKINSPRGVKSTFFSVVLSYDIRVRFIDMKNHCSSAVIIIIIIIIGYKNVY
jgi:hypothetical protein